jgi:hypothetical protein
MHIGTNQRNSGGFLQFFKKSGGFAYFIRKCGGFLELTLQKHFSYGDSVLQ